MTLILVPIKSNDSKQMRHTLTYRACRAAPDSFLPHNKPWQKRDQTDLEEETSFSDLLPWQHKPSLPQSTCQRAPTHQLVVRGDHQPGFPVTAQSINKGASSASWLHDMDTCPLSIGPKIGDFHKGQPTAGRQEPQGHCHPGLNWNVHLGDKGCL